MPGENGHKWRAWQEMWTQWPEALAAVQGAVFGELALCWPPGAGAIRWPGS